MQPEKRRSGRLKLTIPLRVHAKDEMGRTYQIDARTIILSRHGALINVSRPLRLGQVVELVNTTVRSGAFFRVVGPVSPPTEKGTEWAVEYVNPKENIWGVRFPAPQKERVDEPQALLECQACHSVAMSQISLEEADVLETSGILSRPCESCGKTTLCSFAVQALTLPAPAGEEEASKKPATLVKGKEQREGRRVSLQLPALIRDYYGGVEITKTANASKGGFCFASEKTYLVGQGIVVVCPYRENSEDMGVPARIVWRQDVAAIRRRYYGVRYGAKS